MPSDGGGVGQQPKLRGDVGHGGRRRLRTREQRLLAGALDAVARARLETREGRARRNRARCEFERARIERPPLGRDVTPVRTVEQEPRDAAPTRISATQAKMPMGPSRPDCLYASRPNTRPRAASAATPGNGSVNAPVSGSSPATCATQAT
jgi:hypothetical protein